MTRGSLHDQAATEYLTTYGWALLIITIVAAVLIAYRVLSPSTYVSNTCALPGGFGCAGSVLAVNGAFQFNMTQNTGDPVNITAVACDTNQSLVHAMSFVTPIYVPSGGNYTFAVQCYSNGAAFNGVIGSLYSGYILINYTDLVTNVQSTTVGTIAAKVSVSNIVLKPYLTFSTNPVIVGNSVTIGANCQGSDTCAVDIPLGTHQCSATSSCTTTPTPSKGTYTYYANDLTDNLWTSGNLVVAAASTTSTSSTTTTLSCNVVYCSRYFSESDCPVSCPDTYSTGGICDKVFPDFCCSTSTSSC